MKSRDGAIMKRLHFILTLGVLLLLAVCPVFAYPAGANYTVENASVGVFTYLPLSASDIAYPQDLWYVMLAAAIISMILTVWFLTKKRNDIPVKAMFCTTTVSFGLFMMLAFMAPMTAKLTVVVTATQIINVATYIFSPWVSYLMWGLCAVNLILMFYCFILWFVGLGELKQKAEQEKERAYFEDLV